MDLSGLNIFCSDPFSKHCVLVEFLGFIQALLSSHLSFIPTHFPSEFNDATLLKWYSSLLTSSSLHAHNFILYSVYILA